MEPPHGSTLLPDLKTPLAHITESMSLPPCVAYAGKGSWLIPVPPSHPSPQCTSMHVYLSSMTCVHECLVIYDAMQAEQPHQAEGETFSTCNQMHTPAYNVRPVETNGITFFSQSHTITINVHIIIANHSNHTSLRSLGRPTVCVCTGYLRASVMKHSLNCTLHGPETKKPRPRNAFMYNSKQKIAPSLFTHTAVLAVCLYSAGHQKSSIQLSIANLTACTCMAKCT
mmetsp:Transcript_29130/g.64385  ORF Transcript_29130/g.64385 Transcript_29130/m.64385 type:complete len:227 (+) Transcript_29130:305-985(+)